MSNTLSNSTPYSPPSLHPVLIDSSTGVIQHYANTVGSSIGGFAPAFTTSTPSIVSAITSTNGVQNTAACFATYYIFIGGNTNGTVSVAIGPSANPTNYVIPASAGNSATNHAITVRVPSSWYIKVAVTNGATVNTVNILTEGSF